jgi:hypothetical protein
VTTAALSPDAAGPEQHQAEDAAALAERQFLDALRSRVAWQADAAARLRATQPQPEPALDVLDVWTLGSLVDAHPDSPRAAEWAAFLAELCFLVESDGRLPASLERLVRVVFSDLL